MSDRIPNIKKWVLSPHAAARIIERKISIDEMNLIFTEPDFVLHQGPKYIFSKSLMKRSDNYIAAVIIEKKEDLWLVITVMVNFQKK
ncbi:MAG: DUF4258 domain-containing protein [Bdellovibrionaceae bacterium]|nr:DUF4258 domain-containing protein [Bdellovibrio sp.]